MGWLFFIIVGGFFLYLTTKNANSNLKNKIRTEEGYPKIDVKVIQNDTVPQGIETLITCTKDELIITSNGYRKKIPHEDIIDITVESASQITNNPQFSFGKAAIGSAVFGGVGAVAGFSGKNEHKMIVISYIKDEEINYMAFLQQSDKERSVKAEAFLLEKICKDMIEIVKDK